jgi:hypothetical protein
MPGPSKTIHIEHCCLACAACCRGKGQRLPETLQFQFVGTGDDSCPDSFTRDAFSGQSLTLHLIEPPAYELLCGVPTEDTHTWMSEAVFDNDYSILLTGACSVYLQVVVGCSCIAGWTVGFRTCPASDYPSCSDDSETFISVPMTDPPPTDGSPYSQCVEVSTTPPRQKPELFGSNWIPFGEDAGAAFSHCPLICYSWEIAIP